VVELAEKKFRKLKFCIILGTRPEIIKLSSIIRFCEENKNMLDYFVLHTGQHYSYEMDSLFFEELELPPAKYNLDIGSGSHGRQTGLMLDKIEQVLVLEHPDFVFVQGDTNTVLAGALAASKLRIKVCHVEAGLRSYDRDMPEELNRIMADNVSDFLFAPTKKAADILKKEGFDKDKIFVTGNTIVDAVLQNSVLAGKKSKIISKLKLEKGNYFLVTAHRQENVDNEQKLKDLFLAFKALYNKFNVPIIFPIHPRTSKMMHKFSINPSKGLVLIEPVGFLDFLQLEANAMLILSDSGGVQEEACILKVPCITLRKNTERPETIDVGCNVLAGTNPKYILDYAEEMIAKKTNWKNPFGSGKSGQRIMEILLNHPSTKLIIRSSTR